MKKCFLLLLSFCSIQPALGQGETIAPYRTDTEEGRFFNEFWSKMLTKCGNDYYLAETDLVFTSKSTERDSMYLEPTFHPLTTKRLTASDVHNHVTEVTSLMEGNDVAFRYAGEAWSKAVNTADPRTAAKIFTGFPLVDGTKSNHVLDQPPQSLLFTARKEDGVWSVADVSKQVFDVWKHLDDIHILQPKLTCANKDEPRVRQVIKNIPTPAPPAQPPLQFPAPAPKTDIKPQIAGIPALDGFRSYPEVRYTKLDYDGPFDGFMRAFPALMAAGVKEHGMQKNSYKAEEAWIMKTVEACNGLTPEHADQAGFNMPPYGESENIHQLGKEYTVCAYAVTPKPTMVPSQGEDQFDKNKRAIMMRVVKHSNWRDGGPFFVQVFFNQERSDPKHIMFDNWPDVYRIMKVRIDRPKRTSPPMISKRAY